MRSATGDVAQRRVSELGVWAVVIVVYEANGAGGCAAGSGGGGGGTAAGGSPSHRGVQRSSSASARPAASRRASSGAEVLRTQGTPLSVLHHVHTRHSTYPHYSTIHSHTKSTLQYKHTPTPYNTTYDYTHATPHYIINTEPTFCHTHPQHITVQQLVQWLKRSLSPFLWVYTLHEITLHVFDWEELTALSHLTPHPHHNTLHETHTHTTPLDIPSLPPHQSTSNTII